MSDFYTLPQTELPENHTLHSGTYLNTLYVTEESSPQPGIIVDLETTPIFCVLLGFQSFTDKPVFECPFAHPVLLFL